jgi:hypothetical protein
MTFINRFYSIRGLNAVAALNISGTAWNLFCVIMFAMGSAVSIMVGQRLGAGRIEEARDVDRKLIFLTEVIHVIIGLGMIVASPLIPRLYNVGAEVQDLTRQMLIIAGLSLPIQSFAHVTYFTIRSGGRTVITFFFDAVYTWVVTVPLAFILTRYTDLTIVQIYACVMFIDIVKAVIGILMLRSDFWARNVVNDTEPGKAYGTPVCRRERETAAESDERQIQRPFSGGGAEGLFPDLPERGPEGPGDRPGNRPGPENRQPPAGFFRPDAGTVLSGPGIPVARPGPAAGAL